MIKGWGILDKVSYPKWEYVNILIKHTYGNLFNISESKKIQKYWVDTVYNKIAMHISNETFQGNSLAKCKNNY